MKHGILAHSTNIMRLMGKGTKLDIQLCTAMGFSILIEQNYRHVKCYFAEAGF